MTGHGAGSALSGGVRARVECFSVNRKGAEVSFSAPRELGGLEPLVREKVLSRVSRGRVSVTASIEAEGAGESLVDLARARAYLGEIRKMQKALGLTGEVAVETILAGPGVLRTGAPAESYWPAVESALDMALDGLAGTRAREGKNLRAELARHLRDLEKLAAGVRPYAADFPRKYRAALMARLERANLPFEISDPRIAAEVAVFADRCDITEELARLASHAGQFRATLASKEPSGRTLEFLAQEMGREWNTIGSKSGDKEISRLVIAAKSTLDKIREQSANVE